jgi:hypothetical protein
MAAENFTLTQAYVRELYDYNPEIGHLISKRHNRPTGQAIGKYLRVEIKGKRYKNHRIIWLWVYGQWPELSIDHINGNGRDNRLCNLRQATNKQNAENRPGVRAASGMKGVYATGNGRWKSTIGHKMKVLYLGTYVTKEEAHFAYQQAAEKFHTHNPTAHM